MHDIDSSGIIPSLHPPLKDSKKTKKNKKKICLLQRQNYINLKSIRF
jgi:hypothetical protein